MTMSVPERKSGSEGKEEESEDESEILEESPCGRWQKRKEQIYSYIYATFPYEDWQQLDGSDISSTIENNPAALFQASSPINNPLKDIKGSTVSMTSTHQQL